MSTYIDSILLFILCGIVYPGKQFDALHLLGILFLIALYCFELVSNTNRNRSNLSIIVLIFSFFFPELSVLLPWHSYVLFLNRLPAFALLYALPFSVIIAKIQVMATLRLFLLWHFPIILHTTTMCVPNYPKPFIHYVTTA